MLAEIILCIILACSWIGLKGVVNLPTFIFGLLLGALIISIFGKRSQLRQLHIYRVGAAIKLIFIFLYELVVANVQVLFKVFAPKLNIKPGIIKIPLEVQGPFWITTLCNMITLTPGTLTIEVSNDNKFIYVHCLDIDDEEKIIAGIKNTFEKNLLEVSRP